MLAVRNFRIFLILLTLFFSTTTYATVDFCARIDDSVDESLLHDLMIYRPQVFKETCDSNVIIEEYPTDVIRIRGTGDSNQPVRMIFKNDFECDTVVALPPTDLEGTMDQFCRDFLGCGYRYKGNSLFYDLFQRTSEKKISDGKIQEVLDDSFQLYEWSRESNPNKTWVNRLIIKSFQCLKAKENYCNDEIQPMFERRSEPNQKVVFVIDVSASVEGSRCYDMDCRDFIIESFKAQLKNLHATTLVNLYLYNAHNEDGRRVFNHLVTIPELEKKFQTILERNLIRGLEQEDEALGIVRVPTHIFQLEELYDQPLDRVYVFSDFMDYRAPTGSIAWDVLLPNDIAKLQKASWELVTRSFARLDWGSELFFQEFQPQRYLGHVQSE